MTYLKENYSYWQKGYNAPNVESFIFRFYGFYLKNKKKLKLLDFGCGQGAAVNFFNNVKIDSIGVDISKTDIKKAKKKYPRYKKKFLWIDSIEDLNNKKYFNKFDVIVGSQSFYYLSNLDFKKLIVILNKILKKNGIIFASMISHKSTLYKNSKKFNDGLRIVNKDNKKRYSKHYINFTKDYNDTLQKFSKFKKIDLGYYSVCFDRNNDSNHHYIFIGKK
tara:strand:+ start:971 stop:1630 length:660 start_codon:yes stop_codon:yes gene_type:complete